MFIAQVGQYEASGQNGNLQRGVVVYDAQNDYHIVKVGGNNARYVIVKRYSGPTFSRDDVLTGNNIVTRFSYCDLFVNNNITTTQVFVEYHYSNINTCFAWLENQGQVSQTTHVDPVVYICTGGYATRYHSRSNCSGLGNCGGQIVEMTETQARNQGRTPCQRCY